MSEEKEGLPLDGICGGAVGIVLARMDTHPDEFFGDEKKWAFIYKEYFRDIMTESEKGMLHEKLKEIRRMEFSQRVMTTLVEGRDQEQQEEEYSPFGSPQPKRQGLNVMYDGNLKMRLSNTDLELAKKWGMSPTEYARKKAGL